MRLTSIAAASAVLIGLQMSTAAYATPVQFGSSGLYFDYISAPGISWANAEAAAAADVFDGVNGYLAVVTSSSENAFLLSLAPSFGSFAGSWLGGEVNALDQGIWQVGPLAGQQFSTGQISFGGAYVNWGGIEPNNAPSALYMNIGASLGGNDPIHIGPGQWADAGNGVAGGGDPIQGYFVEYGVTPLPSTWIMMMSALAALGFMGYRRRTHSVGCLAG